MNILSEKPRKTESGIPQEVCTVFAVDYSVTWKREMDAALLKNFKQG